MSAINM